MTFVSNLNLVTEEKQKQVVGTPVKTHIIDGGNWTDERSAIDGACGIVSNYSNSHGLCYEVTHTNGTKGWYDPDELCVIDENRTWKNYVSELSNNDCQKLLHVLLEHFIDDDSDVRYRSFDKDYPDTPESLYWYGNGESLIENDV